MLSNGDNTYVSLIIPVWNEEEEIIRSFNLSLTKALKGVPYPYQIIIVDDGSTNRLYDFLRFFFIKDKRVTIIKLTKNFGQAAAILAGCEYAKGDIIVTLDIDYNLTGEDISKIINMVKAGSAMVSGYRSSRQDSLFLRRIPSRVMNRIMNIRTGVRLRDWGCSFCAIRSGLTKELKLLGRNARFIKPVLAKAAESLTEVKIRHQRRSNSNSKYNLFNLVKIGLDFLLFYSTRPSKSNIPLFVIDKVEVGR